MENHGIVFLNFSGNPGNRCLWHSRGSSWALTVGKSDFFLQENYGEVSQIGRSYSAKLRHFLSV